MRTTFNHTDGAFFENDGALLYYEEAGTPEAPALVWLHGGMGHLETFNGITPKFAPHFRMIGLDSRGHGRSSLGEKGLRYEFLQNDVEALVKHLNLDSFSILGFSDGGLVAYRLAAFTELPINKIVAVGAPWKVEQERFLNENRAKITGAAMRERQPDYFEIYNRLNPEPDFDRFIALSLEMWLDESESGHPNDAISRVKCPVLAVRGDKDHLAPLEVVTGLVGVLEDVAISNIAFGGHLVYEEQQEVFWRQSQTFLGI